MRRSLFHCVFFLFLVTPGSVTSSFHSIALFAQSVASGTIEGTVVDSTGAIVVGAMVEVRNPITGFEQTAVTDRWEHFGLRIFHSILIISRFPNQDSHQLRRT